MQAGSGGRRGSAFLRWLRDHRWDAAVLAPVLALTLVHFYPLLPSADMLYDGLDITRQF